MAGAGVCAGGVVEARRGPVRDGSDSAGAACTGGICEGAAGGTAFAGGFAAFWGCVGAPLGVPPADCCGAAGLESLAAPLVFAGVVCGAAGLESVLVPFEFAGLVCAAAGLAVWGAVATAVAGVCDDVAGLAADCGAALA